MWVNSPINERRNCHEGIQVQRRGACLRLEDSGRSGGRDRSSRSGARPERSRAGQSTCRRDQAAHPRCALKLDRLPSLPTRRRSARSAMCRCHARRRRVRRVRDGGLLGGTEPLSRREARSVQPAVSVRRQLRLARIPRPGRARTRRARQRSIHHAHDGPVLIAWRVSYFFSSRTRRRRVRTSSGISKSVASLASFGVAR